MADVKIQWRKDYGDTWKTITGPHPIGLALLDRVRSLHREDPTKHLAVYLDGDLSFGFFPNTGVGDVPDVIVNGRRYVPKET